ncbi:MXAN_6577-like cysteine-rich protein [Sorangium sp. So ce1024]|uniref:MXAN_6577-like cysteine-rich protein n=1 Tax=Sorangium sp. So ce1024 TaxID=3133327 RepID=UPI003F048932
MQMLRSRSRLAPTYTLLWLAAAVLTSVASCSDGGTTTPPTCVAPLASCDGVCVDTSSDQGHCGACGVACEAGEACVAGACVGCAQGQTACGDGCVDLQSDEGHCGSCNSACEDGQTCEDGVCQGEEPCASGRTQCGGECVDTSSDPAHCGACDTACGEGQTCEDGACQDEDVCGEGLTTCGDACVDLQTDAANCGECGAACGDGQDCVAGTCQGEDVCGSGLTTCGDACVDLQTDAANCGECGAACNASQVCQAGMCACTVSPGQDLGNAVPQIVNGTTAGGSSTYSPSCVATSSSERIYAFTAATAGVYSFDSAGSGYNVVLALLDAAGCSELACSADPGAAVVTADLAAGQTVYIVVDGADGEVGTFELNIRRQSAPSCPTGAFGSAVPQTITGSTVGRPNSVTPTAAGDCGVAESADAGYTFTAPVTGDYVFDTYGSAFDTVLHVHDGACRGPQLACNDDTRVEQSEVTVALVAGQTVVVVVDGARNTAAGAFTLNVRRAVPPPTCDGQGVCGETAGNGCIACAFAGNCADELRACTDSESCINYVSCIRTCGSTAACGACRTADPEGAALYDAALACAICTECPIDCAGSDVVACP